MKEEKVPRTGQESKEKSEGGRQRRTGAKAKAQLKEDAKSTEDQAREIAKTDATAELAPLIGPNEKIFRRS